MELAASARGARAVILRAFARAGSAIWSLATSGATASWQSGADHYEGERESKSMAHSVSLRVEAHRVGGHASVFRRSITKLVRHRSFPVRNHRGVRASPRVRRASASTTQPLGELRELLTRLPVPPIAPSARQRWLPCTPTACQAGSAAASPAPRPPPCEAAHHRWRSRR